MTSLWKRLTSVADTLGSVFEKDADETGSPSSTSTFPRAATPVAEGTSDIARLCGSTAPASETRLSMSSDSSPSTPNPQTIEYCVQKGDSLITVAMRHHMSTAELRRLNHMYGTANLYSGQIIKVKQPSKVRMSAGANTSKGVQGETQGSSTRDLPSRSTMGSSLPLKKAAASTNLAHSQQKPTKLRVFLCTEPDHRIAGTLTMSYQLLLFEPSPSDAVVKEGGILKYQFCMDVRDLIGGCEISHTTNILTERDEYISRGDGNTWLTSTNEVPFAAVNDVEKREVAASTESEEEGERRTITIAAAAATSASNSASHLIAFDADVDSDSGSNLALGSKSSKISPMPASAYDQTQWSMLQVFWRESSRSKPNSGQAEGSSCERYYMLFLVPKLEVESFLDSMHRFIEQQREASSCRSKRHLGARSPNLTAGAVDLLRRSATNTPEPSRMYTEASMALGGKSMFMSNLHSRKSTSIESRSSTKEITSAAGDSAEARPRKAELRNFASVHVPKVIGGISRMLTNDDRINVACALPYDLRAYNWQLEYSSSVHGLSWHTLHRCIAKTGPNIVLIRTTEGEVLGGYASQNWRTNGEYVGTGECAVFHCKPGPFSMYSWTGSNSYFMLATDNMMAMGGGGDFAFQIDARFKGTTGTSETFGNRLLLDSGEREFHVFDIEVSQCFSCFDLKVLSACTAGGLVQL